MSLTLLTTREDHRIAWLAALAITLHIVESALPSPIPGVKPGLANIITILTLIQFGWSTAAWVNLLRVLVGSVLVGSFLSPTFILSLAGAVSSIMVLRVASWLPLWGRKQGIETIDPEVGSGGGSGFGPIGYSVLAAMAHMAGQFYTAYLLFIPHDALFHLLPVLMTAAVIFGIISGFIAHLILGRSLNQPRQSPVR